ncbi:hypothetical protein [Paracerasibacillus soli]|uniref:Uncharacterized protein n=1 Tax=Paracerasibacillus soli TaxID=480284 RepID=A0ABU5CV30_9BACI|nr:hypothetical protein [Virgibacillus soli]MDY0410241.1 hypothetical protein [Virgibacillus soli]
MNKHEGSEVWHARPVGSGASLTSRAISSVGRATSNTSTELTTSNRTSHHFLNKHEGSEVWHARPVGSGASLTSRAISSVGRATSNTSTELTTSNRTSHHFLNRQKEVRYGTHDL